MPITVEEMRQCEKHANVVLFYREANWKKQLTAPCWLDEWAFGYFCALRDTGMINNFQWAYLCDVFHTERYA